ncbi:hypothetical protein ATK36_3442 [Amycolatopsis sulphurea]|uniref:HEAT repeat domain-containing protein n=1 Tax=Amycolatopsis sulphurea TaxID=76022 RepID=A0A2A9FAA6_9PSEU|nr:hypothetical protein [Amycolatopsis sulphurea]PFG48357.1 hypothetical protein ATK36_3442 [Amycolatopsis sulphurea]
MLLALALFANQLESVEGGGFKLQLGAVTAKLREAEEAEASGDQAGAERLRREAQLLFAATESIASEYEAVREHNPYGQARTQAMEELVAQARKMAEFDFVSADAIEQLFRSGQDGNRITAIGLMRAKPELAKLPLLTEVIRRSRSSFEQWHALRVCLELVRRGTSAAQQEEIRAAIAAAGANGTLRGGLDGSRVRLAAMIESELRESGSTSG